MKCENCNQNEATFFYEENVNGVKKSMRLCAECAAKMQHVEQFQAPFAGFGSSLLNGLFGHAGAATEPAKSCPGCKATFRDLQKSGKAFCPRCYETFREELKPSLRSLHGGSLTHVGRAPADRRAKKEKRDRLDTLKKELAEAIRTEQFEEAAKLRDQIRALEKEEGGN